MSQPPDHSDLGIGDQLRHVPGKRLRTRGLWPRRVGWLGPAPAGLPPALRLVLVLQAAAPPIGSAAVFAMILGLDGVLAVLATFAAACADEFHQMTLPSRGGGWSDVWVDSGATTRIMIMVWLQARRRCRNSQAR